MNGHAWNTHHSVWAVMSPKYGINLYVTEREAKRAMDNHPGSLITKLNVMQELDENWEPMFKGDS